MTTVIVAPRVESPTSDTESVANGGWVQIRPSKPYSAGGQWVQDVWGPAVPLTGSALTFLLDPLTDVPYELWLHLPNGRGGFVDRTEFRIVAGSTVNWDDLVQVDGPGGTPVLTDVVDSRLDALEAAVGGVSGGASNLASISDMSPFMRTVNDDVNATNARTTLGAADATATVNLSGNQTVGGVKTFSSSPIVPTATAGTNTTAAASTAFVQSAVSGVVAGSVAWTDVSGKPSTFPPTLPITTAGVTGLETRLDDLEAGVGSPGTPQGEQILIWDATSQTYEDSVTGSTTYDTSKYVHRFWDGPDPQTVGYTPAINRDRWRRPENVNPGVGNPNTASVGLSSWPIKSIDGVRGNAEMVLYTYRADQVVSPANQFGIEIVFDAATRVPLAMYNRATGMKYTSSSESAFTTPTPIAAGQFVLSGHGLFDQAGYPSKWLRDTFTHLVSGNRRINAAQVVTLSTVTTNPPTPGTPTGTWLSGQSDTVTTKNGAFATWRGRSVEIAGNWGPEVNSEMPAGPTYEITQGGSGAYAHVPAIDYAIGAFGTGTTWAQAAGGSMDSIWTQTVLALKTAWGTRAANKCFIRIAHEFNGNWYPWKVADADVSNYIAGFRRFANIIRANFPGAQIVWCMNAGSSYSYNIRDLYPGDAYVDVIASDDYNRDPFVDTQGEFDAQIIMDSTSGGELGMETVRLFALAHGKPYALSEWSNSGFDNGGGGGESPAYMQAMYDYFTEHGGTGAGNVIYEIVFNVAGYGDRYSLYPESLEPGNVTTAAKYKELWGSGLTVPPTDPPVTPGALPLNVMSIWHHRWAGPTLGSYPTNVKDVIDLVVLGLAQSGGAGTGNLSYAPVGQTVAAHAADIRAFVARGIDVVMGIGGASDGGITITNTAQVDQAFNSISAFRTTYGITGIDIDLEPSGSLWNQASLVSLCTRLKTAHGAGFIIGVTPALYDPHTSKWMALAQALMAANAFDYMAPMLYDFPEANVAGTGAGSLAAVSLQKCQIMKAAGIPENKMILGFMMKPPAETYPNSTDSTAKINAAYTYVKAAMPGLRGAFFWEDKIQLARSWDGVLALAPVVDAGAAPDPTPDPDNPAGLPVLGFSINGAALAGPIQPAHYANLASFSPEPVWIRVGFNPDGGTSVWQPAMASYLAAIEDAGMNCLLRASFPNSEWSGSGTVNATNYGNFVGSMAQYAEDLGWGPDRIVFEYPNEINSTSISAATYNAAAANAYPKLKAVNPDYKIIGGSENVYASNWQAWLTSLFQAGFKNNSDGVSFHNYDTVNDHAKYTFLRNLMTTHQWLSAMVWLTEFGTSTPPNPSGNPLGGQTPENQATRLVNNLRDIGTDLTWITHAFVYADVDIPSRQTSDPFEANFGIYYNTSSWVKTPKPAVAAIKNLYNVSGTVATPPSLSASVMAAPTFPITVRSDGKGFQDNTGAPFTGLADTAWNAMSRMTLAEWTSYISTRRTQGYTSVLVSMLDINSRSRTQVTTGVTPFTGTGDSANFAAPNSTYFDAVKAKLDVADAAGMFAWIIPAWMGYQGNMWRTNWATTASDYTKANSYATFLGAEFGDRDGIGWLHGGDNNPDTANNATDGSTVKVSLVNVTNVFANGLKTAASVDQLATYHTGRTYNASTWFSGQSWYDIDAAYAGLDVPAETTIEYARGRSAMLTEAYYENRANTGLSSPDLTRLQFRNTAYHALFTGALMAATGNEVVWQVRDFYVGRVWNEATYGVNSVGASDLTVLSRVMASLPTKHWVADASAPLVTTNRGSGVTLSPGLKATDNTAAMVYVPAAKAITVTHSSITGTKGALWVNPQTAATITVDLGAGTTSNLTVPSGWTDAVLLIKTI